MGSNDLRDRLWRDMYDSGMSPEDVVFDELGLPRDLDDEEGLEAFMREELFG